MKDRVVILGAGSGIARALARLLAARGVALVLTGRDPGDLERSAADLRVRFAADVSVEAFDAVDYAGHAAFFARAGGEAIDGVILCHAYAGDQEATERHFDQARRTIDVTFTSAVSILNVAASTFERRRRGYIVAISSVAGDRGRRKNYTYGAAKAGLTAYLSGLRARLAPAGVQVLEVRPGFVDTPLLDGRVSPESPLLATPERVARDIDLGIRLRRNVIYTPWYWRAVMTAVRAIPEPIFKRLRI